MTRGNHKKPQHDMKSEGSDKQTDQEPMLWWKKALYSVLIIASYIAFGLYWIAKNSGDEVPNIVAWIIYFAFALAIIHGPKILKAPTK